MKLKALFLLSAVLVSCQSKSINFQEQTIPSAGEKCQSVAESVVSVAMARSVYCQDTCSMSTYMEPLLKSPLQQGAMWVESGALPEDALNTNVKYGYFVETLVSPESKARVSISKHSVELDENCRLMSVKKAQ